MDLAAVIFIQVLYAIASLIVGAYHIHNDGWTGEPWASSLPSSP